MSKTFEEKKNSFIEKFNETMEAYDELTKCVSPKNFRTTGHHFTEMKKIKEDIPTLKEITSTEQTMYDMYTEKYL